MTIVPIYDKLGKKIDQLSIDDTIEYVDGRVQKGSTCYYKGIGVSYESHHSFDVGPEYEVLAENDIFYVGHNVIKKCFVGKSGIFQEKFQPFFSDFIGTCGVKEGTLVLNSTIFEKSSADVIDCICIDKENQQFYYLLDYKCNRESYLKYNGDPVKLRELIDYMLKNNWNFLWDKNSIGDISKQGLVTDCADLFISDSLSHKIGTVYSVLCSLMQNDVQKYNDFLKICGLAHYDQRSLVFNSVKLLQMNGIDITEFIKYEDLNHTYKYIVLNYLASGKNCAYCACDLYRDNGEKVKEQYLKNIEDQLSNIVMPS
jgi:hypothetical protein